MAISILICDDSALARKQLARVIPSSWGANIEFAQHGWDAIAKLEAQSYDLLFLDLTMPELDGYGTLEEMRARRITTQVVVVSGDIQPKAQQKVAELGAKAFIKKPVDKPTLISTLGSISIKPEVQATYSPQPVTSIQLRRRDIYLEVANVAIGRAADSLARHFDVFVHMPLPNVNLFEMSELQMTLRHLASNENMSGVCQGFSGEGIAGEALVLLSDSSVTDLTKLMDYPEVTENSLELELLMDVSNILVGAFLKGIGEQAEVRFFQSAPVLLGQHVSVNSVIESTKGSFNRIMAFEVSYSIDNTNIKCDLLLMIVDESLPILDNKLAYLLDDE
ncbi:response regulator [Aliivibrio sp. S4TY2]|uniref:Response regulator n=1 Tax=Aliivibrio finisterrensis TaxID=511998 RepID=A0A4Q5KP13_9GAMM|nr:MULTISPECIES: response regulator [Aliivibrio]MDD9157861.1 response regulator [Aliivibrio sp. S4TY2]MDD9161787.1 response regulator [Aliivibrio sp. S4TY1]MDD9165817.1 response regulator [Aliivibrio sp. S4MY2]MDD9169860.1 response regulator [Aliivibrio sp. S4MY4]MDD9175900.1 response regulator [Aliivibrio sp. S3TY1]